MLGDYIRASNGSGEAVMAVVTTNRLIGSATLVVDSVLNWPTRGIATSGDLDISTGLIDPNTATVFKYHLDGSIIMIDSYAPGYSDVGNTVGQAVVIKPATDWADEVADQLDSLDTTKLDKDLSVLTAKTTPVDADLAVIGDSAASNAPKKLTFANLWAWVLAKIQAVTSLSGFDFFLDEDDMASDSATKVPSQQSVKSRTPVGVGGIYATTTETSAAAMAAKFGGTWVLIGTDIVTDIYKDFYSSGNQVGTTGNSYTVTATGALPRTIASGEVVSLFASRTNWMITRAYSVNSTQFRLEWDCPVSTSGANATLTAIYYLPGYVYRRTA